MDNIQSNPPFNQHNQHNPNIPPQTPVYPPQGAPAIHPQALPLHFMQQQGVPPLPPAPGFLPYPLMAQPARPPATLYQPPHFNPGPKRPTPESGFEPRPVEELKRGRATPSPPAAPMQPAPFPAASLSGAPSGYFYASASFPYLPGRPMHTGQGTSSASMSPACMPDVTPQILEEEKTHRLISVEDLPGQLQHRAQEGKMQSCAPPLYKVMATKDVDALRRLLADPHFNVHARDTHGCTVLHYAAALGLANLVDALAKMGIDPDVRDNKGRTALHYAVLSGKKATTIALLAVPDIDINLEVRHKKGHTALMLAVAKADTAIVEALLNAPKININVRDEHGDTPLFKALESMKLNTGKWSRRAYQKYEAIVDALLSRKEIDVCACNKGGDNALMLAAQSKAKRVVRKLLGMEIIDINARNKNGETALMLASAHGSKTIERDLLHTSGIAINAQNEDGNTVLMKAAKRGDIDMIRILLAAPGVDINAKNSKGATAFTLAVKRDLSANAVLLFARTETNIAAAGESNNAALALAAASGDIAAVQDLPAKPDIDVNASAAGNLTPLMLAAANGHEAVVRTLLRVPGIDVNYRGLFASSALMLAASNGHTAIVKSLLNVIGIEVNAENYDEFTALMLAAEYGHDTIVESLLAKPNIDVNIVGENAHNALELAVQEGHVAVVKLLLAKPTIDVDVVLGKSLETAIEQQNETITQLLLAFPGIGINAASADSGRTALMQAAKNGDAATVSLLLAMPDIDINAQDLRDRTALTEAAENGHDAIVRALLAMPDIRLDIKQKVPADIRLDIKQKVPGWTALEVAKFNEHNTIACALQDHVLPSPSSSARVQETLQAVFASAKGMSDLSAANASKLDDIRERLENGKYAAAEIPALFASVAPMGDAASEAFVRSLAFGFCTGHFRNADGQLDETIGIFHNAQELRAVYDATVSKISSAAGNIDLHRIARSNLLGIAAREGNVRMIRGLALLGANVNLPSPNGKTALAIAVERKDWAACAELISHGALPLLPDASGYPALYHIVQAFGSDDDSSESVALLIRYLRIKGITFDIPVKNPDKTMRATRPVVMLNDLLARKVQSWGKFGDMVYGLKNVAPSNGTAPRSTADTSSSLSDTSSNVAPARRDDKA